MHPRILFLAGLPAIALNCSAGPAEFRLAAGGKPLAAIVLSSDATAAERTAAKELSTSLARAAGADFHVYAAGSEPVGVPRILVGQSAEAKMLLGDIDWKSLKFDGIAIKFAGTDLVLAGDRPRGTLYAVYTFLEDYVGCKWWTATASYTPSVRDLTVRGTDLIHLPPFLYRETFYGPVKNRNAEFAARLKLNGHHQSISEDFGGHYTIIGFVHTMNRLLPPSVHFEDHPDWYALVDGNRTPDTQLCLTNEEMTRELVKQALTWIDENPSAGMISISQNDTFGPCQCAACQAVARAEGSESGPLIQFVNSAAAEIEKKYPDFLVETLAYQYTRKAPKNIKPRDNVMVRLCTIECDFSTPLTSQTNASFYRDIQDWQRISKRLYVWDYVVNFHNLLVPFPNWRVLAPNIRIFAGSNVIGLFEQGDGYNMDSAFANMKIWVMSHLMWDPTLDQRKLMNDFATGYYGPAAPSMIQYLDLTSDAVEEAQTYLGCFIGSTLSYMNQQVMGKANDLFDQAERSVSNNPVLLERVKLKRLALDHAWILQTVLDRSGAGTARGMDVKALCEDYINRAQASGNDFIGEDRKISETGYATLRSRAAKPPVPKSRRIALPPAAVKGLRASDWADAQENAMSLYQPGTCSEIVSDPDASDGRAVRMPGSILDWATQASVRGAMVAGAEEVSVHVSVKVKKTAASGVAFTTGIYDTVNRKHIANRSVNIEEIKSDGYVDYNLGSYPLEAGSYAWVAPPGSADLVDSVYVDRVFLVKSK